MLLHILQSTATLMWLNEINFSLFLLGAELIILLLPLFQCGYNSSNPCFHDNTF